MLIKQKIAVSLIAALLILNFKITPVFSGDGLTGGEFVYGARSIGLSNAFAAVAGDINSVHYNPAGIAGIEKNIFSTFYNNPYQLNWYTQYNISLALPFKTFVNSISYSANDIDFKFENEGLDDLRWMDKKITYTLGANISQNTLIGFNLSYTTISSNVDASAKGYSFDAGIINKITEDFSIGAAIKNIYNRKKWSGGSGLSEDADMEYRLGARFDIYDRLNIIGDVVGSEGERFKSLNIGSEFILWESVRVSQTSTSRYFKRSGDYYPENLAFVVRGGIEKDMYLDKDMRYTAGMSIGSGMTKVDYAMKIDNKGLEKQQHFFSLGIQFGDSKRAQIEDDTAAEIAAPPLPSVNNQVLAAVAPSAVVRQKQQRKAEMAVVNFKNSANNQQFNWLVSGLPDMIINSLKNSDKVVTKNRADVSDMVAMVTPDVSVINSDIASQIGILLNADVILVGAFEVSKNNIIKINYKLFNTDTRREMLNKTINGQVGDLFGLINQMNNDINAVVANLGVYYTLKNN